LRNAEQLINSLAPNIHYVIDCITFYPKKDISRSNEVAIAAAKLGTKSGICTARDKCKMEMGHLIHKCVTYEEYIHIPCSVSENPEEPMCPDCYETFE